MCYIISKMRETKKISRAEFKALMKWTRTDSGYKKEILGKTYEVRQNEETREWHLYIDNEWSIQLDGVKHGKLEAILRAYGLR